CICSSTFFPASRPTLMLGAGATGPGLIGGDFLERFVRSRFRFISFRFLCGLDKAFGLLWVVFRSLFLWHTQLHGVVPSQALFPATAFERQQFQLERCFRPP